MDNTKTITLFVSTYVGNPSSDGRPAATGWYIKHRYFSDRGEFLHEIKYNDDEYIKALYQGILKSIEILGSSTTREIDVLYLTVDNEKLKKLLTDQLEIKDSEFSDYCSKYKIIHIHDIDTGIACEQRSEGGRMYIRNMCCYRARHLLDPNALPPKGNQNHDIRI